MGEYTCEMVHTVSGALCCRRRTGGKRQQRRYVVVEPLRAGYETRAMVRIPRQGAFFPAGNRVVAGDPTDADALGDALDGPNDRETLPLNDEPVDVTPFASVSEPDWPSFARWTFPILFDFGTVSLGFESTAFGSSRRFGGTPHALGDKSLTQ